MLQNLALPRWLPSLLNLRVLYLALGVSGVMALAVSLGYVSAIFPWWLTLAMLVAVTGTLVLLASPFIGLVVTMAFAFRVVPAVLSPEIPLGAFKLKPYEATLMITFAGVAWRWYIGSIQHHYKASDIRRLFVASALMIGCILVSTAYSRFGGGGDPARALSEGRAYFSLLAIPILPFILPTQKEWRWLVVVIFSMACIVSFYVLIQLSTGINIMGARLEDLELSKGSGVMRSLLVGGGGLISFGLYYTYGAVREQPSRLLWLGGIVVLLLLGLLGTFTRSSWMTTAFGIVVVAWLYGGIRSAAVMGIVGSAFLALTLLVAYVVKPDAADAAVGRVVGIADEIEHGKSFGWRLRENGMAMDAIVEHPIMGVGIGGAYRRVDLSPDTFENAEYFIHNGFLVFPVKMGLLGYAFIAALFAAYIQAWRSSRFVRGGDTLYRRNAFFGMALTAVVGAFNSPAFSSFHGLLLGALMIAGTLPLLTDEVPDQHDPIIPSKSR